MTPLEWLRNIKCPGLPRGHLSALVERADSEGIAHVRMADLADVMMEDRSTVIRSLNYLEHVGAISREHNTRGGRGHVQVFRLHVDTDPRLITRACRLSPHLSKLGPRLAETVVTLPHFDGETVAPEQQFGGKLSQQSVAPPQQFPKLSQQSVAASQQFVPDELETVAINRSNAATVSAADESRMRARAVGNYSPGTTGRDEEEITQTPVSSGGANDKTGTPGSAWRNGTATNGTAHGAAPPRDRSQIFIRPPTDDELRRLHERYDSRFPEGADDVERRIQNALSNDAQANWRNRTFNYLDSWLDKDALTVARILPAISRAAAEGRLKDIDAPPTPSRYAKYRHGTDLDTGLPRAAS